VGAGSAPATRGRRLRPGPVTVYAKTSADPSSMADVQPLLVLCFEGCHTTLADYGQLMNVPAMVRCRGQLRVKPGDPDNSVLFETMAGTSCGDQMPPGGPYLGTDQLDLVRAWISQGAANN
jgi:hypothetical protein